MNHSAHRIGVPWLTPIMSTYNSFHPLPMSLLDDTPEFQFVSDLQAKSPAAQTELAHDIEHLRAELRQLPPPVTAEAIETFIQSRDLESQLLMSGPMDLLFLHTLPATLGQRPWVLHIESTLPMFEPFFGHLRTATIDLEATPAWHFVRHLVRAPECRAIFTHIAGTRDALPRLFRDETLARKVHYIPLGLGLPADVWRAADDAIRRKSAKTNNDEFVVLFTNSWHQDPESFYKRGGAETLIAFSNLMERNANCRLLLRTALPENIDPVLRQQIRNHPQIELFEEPLSDQALFGLLCRADVFMLPSISLHSISYLRAMATGAVIVTTDVMAVEEFLTDGESAIILPGRRGVCYWEDREHGLLREDLEKVRKPSEAIAKGILNAVERLMADQALRNRLRLNARRNIDRRHGLMPWREGFYSVLRTVLAPSAKAP